MKFKIITYPIITLFFITIFLFSFPKQIKAQIPEPYVRCDQTKDNEFHSLRPYQASPCNIPIELDEQALLCGNDLVVRDTAKEPWDCWPKASCASSWTCTGCGGVQTCTFYDPRKFGINLNAFGSELPIAGNTELVKGSDPLLGTTIAGAAQLLNIIKDRRLKGESNKDPGFDTHNPPDPSKYSDYRAYYEAYQEWRGKKCIHTPREISIIWPIKITITFPSVMVCGELTGGFLEPNYWAMLYPKVPYSSTEDRIGKISVSDMYWNRPESTIEDVIGLGTDWSPHPDERNPGNVVKNNEAMLFFPHMEENVELTSLLQSTYMPEGIAEPIPSIEPVDKPNPTLGEECKLVDVRYNPGDQLFGEVGIPKATVSYTAKVVTQCKMCPLAPCIPCSCEPKHAVFYSDVGTYTPMIDELYTRTVYGKTSVVQKFLPKIDENAPIKEIKDIPAVTDVIHNTKSMPPYSHMTLISTPAEFYIPHFGSIYDYLLKDMQTLLRPKGFPGKPAGLSKNKLIPELDQANEYLSWYLNGTIYRAEQNPLDTSNCIGDLTKRAGLCETINLSLPLTCLATLVPPVVDPFRFPDGKSNCEGLLTKCCVSIDRLLEKPVDRLDVDRVVNNSGPINKLLSQESQWRNIFLVATKKIKGEAETILSNISKVHSTERAKINRHNQIVGCEVSIKPLPFLNIEFGGFPIMCLTESQKNLPPEDSGGGGGTGPTGPCDICEIAEEYNVPCCFLQGIWDIETGQSKNIPTGTYGNLQCCNSIGACGPMQIMGGLLPPLSAGKKFDLCDECDSWELAARLLILKKCVAAGECNSWDWTDDLKEKFPISENELEVVGYYYGMNGCYPDNATQCRWGDGKSYCDAVDSWCKGKGSIPESCTQEWCSALTPPVTCP